MLFKAAPGTSITSDVALALASLVAGAECELSIAERLLVALPHVRVGPTEAYDTERQWLVYSTGAKGMVGHGRYPFVWVGVSLGK